MNILYVVHGYKPAWRVGGPVISVSAAAEALVRKGHSVTVFTTNANLDEDLDVPLDQPVDVDGVEVWYFRREEPLKKWLPFVPYLARSGGFLYCPAIRRALQEVLPSMDVVDTHSPFVYPTYAASRSAFRAGKPLFYHQRGCFDPQRLQFRGAKKRFYIDLIERPAMRRATTLIGLTEAERQSFRALGVDTHCEVVPNGTDLPARRDGSEIRIEAAFGVPADATLVLFMGRLHPIKGADKLLEAFARLPEAARRNVYLIMAGPDEWQLEQNWRGRAAAAGLQDRVIFPGMLGGDVKLDVLSRADLFCLPSVGEGFSMAVLEALASGTAVMLSPGCHFPEAADAGAGIVVDTEVEKMSLALAGLTADRARLRDMGFRGRELVAERYTWNAISDRLVEVYTEGLHRFTVTRGTAGEVASR